MNNAYEILVQKVQSFVRKYYLNILIKGLIFSFTFSTIAIIGFAFLEYFGRFGVIVRTTFFWSFVFFSFLFFFFWVITPILKLIRLRGQITQTQAAKIIGEHFPEVADKLINVIQLKKETTSFSRLLEASILQKSNELRWVPFVKAVNIKENLKYLKYALIPFFVFVGLYASNQEIILTESASRIIDYNTEYIPPPPFEFFILNRTLECVQHEDFNLLVKLEGKDIPTDVFLQTNGLHIKMKKRENHTFCFNFRNLQKPQSFKFIAGSINSQTSKINVLKAPTLLGFEMTLDFPSYTGEQDKTIENNGNIAVPEGTKVFWDFYTENTDSLSVVWNDKLSKVSNISEGKFHYSKVAKKSLRYTLIPENNKVHKKDSINYSLKVIKDAYPIIEVTEAIDSTQLKIKYFKGEVRDDYGFEKILFHIKNGYTGWDSIVPINVSRNLNTETFFFVFNTSLIDFNEGEFFEYYFEVFDNDRVNGSKKSQSRVFEFNHPSKKELQEQQAQKTQELKASLEENVNLAQELQKNLEDLRKKFLEKEVLSWEDKQQVKQTLEKQLKLEKNIENLAKKNKEKTSLKSQFFKQDKRILEKQKQLQELMNDLMTEDMRELFNEMEEMINQMNNQDWMQKLEEMQMNNEDLEKELDRNLEMLKKFEFEEALEETKKELEELIFNQEVLKKENEDRVKPQDEITKKQKKLNQDFQDLSQKIDGLQDKNKALEKKENLKETKVLQEEIIDQMLKSHDNSEKNKRKKVSESQKSTINKMQELEQILSNTLLPPPDSGPPEDMDALRQILENLIDLSLDEEALLSKLTETNNSDPRYVELIHWQNKLNDDSKILEDSLYALSRRQAQIKATINREMSSINNNIQKSLSSMSERHTDKAVAKQQLVMTSANNLALMLSDVLQSMQEDQANKTPGQQQCNKPGSSNPSSGDLKKMQEQLKKQLEKMKKGFGDDKPLSQKVSKDLVIMMGKQELIRQHLERIYESIEGNESGQSDLIKDAIKNMEKTEEDIVNENITEETLIRQNQIIDHLIQAEKAEQERGRENKREAKEGRDLPHQVKSFLEDYKENKRKQAELLKTIPPKLKPYYRLRVNEYFQNISRP